ncbi:4-hydroxybenzoate polyprenyl transferase [Ehrlichia chaffeensis str. Heartland]|uniref:4-hydroxybenzoate octaprenyltransferase n=1 Tax=Ehrlichia chaffeensis TaxID=945 RepID=UPI0002F51B68|nr:4-hydroxybenzoate octaprenyltransferase [Ehrlichia chaffeensis]AHX03540.1 4-hydroxybenzoate polyprenyl transferase [Ehrlichia chaffeensis str. Heartland]AHX06731.1 4-hydroxybenzoate polyprenyl transferase [Ehrlichia chaffeensis str. Liberty]AHX07122.1 4-hydroxybenzoate polyprenyl transferase [Ehrlichia chaffeensis str. Osceola]AHX10161.1 4-hydroxybenzoate polyprenyl transferase [Ehrlichia chaffeensis str. West Paces]
MLCKIKDIISNFRKYHLLLRLHSVEIILLLIFPSLASIALVSHSVLRACGYMFLCSIGAFIMRPAGCIINDIFDRKIDSEVKRTQNRPLANNSLSVFQALKILAILLLCACVLLVLTNMYTIKIAIVSMVLIVLYPLAKRYFAWPQLLLGIVFNTGILMGCTMTVGHLTLSCVLLYIGCIFWTVGYDTIYAAQDKEYDIKLGLQSTAIKFGNDIRLWIGRLYMITVTMWLSAGIIAVLHPIFYLAILIIAAIFYYQYKKSDFDNPEKCMYMFKVNIYVGLILFLGTVFGRIL